VHKVILHLPEAESHVSRLFVVFSWRFKGQERLNADQGLEKVLLLNELLQVLVKLLELVKENFEVLDPAHAVHDVKSLFFVGD